MYDPENTQTCWLDEELIAQYQIKVEEDLKSDWVQKEIAHGVTEEEMEEYLWKDFEDWVKSHNEMLEFYRGEDAYDAFRGA